MSHTYTKYAHWITGSHWYSTGWPLPFTPERHRTTADGEQIEASWPLKFEI